MFMAVAATVTRDLGSDSSLTRERELKRIKDPSLVNNQSERRNTSFNSHGPGAEGTKL